MLLQRERHFNAWRMRRARNREVAGDQDEDPERTYVVTSSSFPNLIATDLRSACRNAAFGGKYEDTVVEHSCDIVRIMCAGDAFLPW